MTKRDTTLEATSKETAICLRLALDGGGIADIHTGIAFLDHMLAQTVLHGRMDLQLEASGDLQVDAHHTVEDCGLALGRALADCLGDKTGIRRFGNAYAPLDEALARVIVDLSGRPSLHYRVRLARPEVGGIDADLFREFFQALVNKAGMTLHIDLLHGVNAHHQIECVFKAFGLALSAATTVIGDSGVPSTKGVL